MYETVQRPVRRVAVFLFSPPLLQSPQTERRPLPPAGLAFSVLSPREREVLQMVAEATPRRRSRAGSTSVKTIEAHRSQIMNKLHIHHIAGLTKFAINEGLTSPEP